MRINRSCCLNVLSLSSSVVILYLRFGAKALQDNFVAELSTHYQNYILSPVTDLDHKFSQNIPHNMT